MQLFGCLWWFCSVVCGEFVRLFVMILFGRLCFFVFFRGNLYVFLGFLYIVDTYKAIIIRIPTTLSRCSHYILLYFGMIMVLS